MRVKVKKQPGEMVAISRILQDGSEEHVGSADLVYLFDMQGSEQGGWTGSFRFAWGLVLNEDVDAPPFLKYLNTCRHGCGVVGEMR